MNKSGTVQVRIPEELKKAVNAILDNLGMTPSEAVLIYYKQIVLNQGIPFEIKIPNAETAEAVSDVRNGKDLKKYASEDELFQNLNV